MSHDVSRRQFIKGAAIGAVGVAATTMLPKGLVKAEGTAESINWDFEADVVIIGAGGSGLPAALKAMEDGSSVMLVEASWDVGGHCAVSEGQFHSGGGTQIQKKYGIEDSADLYYYNHTRAYTDASRYTDRMYARSIANAMCECYEFCMEKGCVVLDKKPDLRSFFKEGGNDPEGVARMTYADASAWPNPYTGTGVAGIGITRPLEKSLREQGAKFLLNYHMDKIYRENQMSGRVLGIMASYTPHIMPGETTPLTSHFSEGNVDSTKEVVNIKANKGVIIATGGSIGNLNFRTMIDPRLGPEYDGLAGMPFSDQDGSGEMAALEIGASLGAMANYMQSSGMSICTPRRFGCRYGYGRGWTPDSKIWKLVVANGIIPDYSSLCIVNMVGNRLGNEDHYAASPVTDDQWKFIDNALSSVFIDAEGDGNAQCHGGPIWAIVDQAAAERNDWKMEQGIVDFDNGYCFKGDTIEELAANIVNKYYEDIKMDPKVLAETIARYNGFVEAGKDEDWGKTSLDHKIEQGPFYAMWCTPSLHDTLAGLRVNDSMQVLDIYGEPIPSLFCSGESSGGMRIHGLGRVMTSGYVAGRAAASVDTNGFATASTALNPAFAGAETSNITKTTSYFELTGQELNAAAAPAAPAAPAAATAAPVDGVAYEGSSDNGLNGKIRLQIVVKDGKMTAIEILEQKETEGIGTPAYEPLIAQALETQSSKLDAISGATVTSKAFMEALTAAMEKAGLK